MFIGRETELKFLEEKYTEPKGQLVVLYGRRRVGKTELSVDANIQKYILTKGCVLYSEVEFLLHQELRETPILVCFRI